MQPRSRLKHPIVVRFLQTISFCLALFLGAIQVTYAQDQPSSKSSGDLNSQGQQQPAEIQELAYRVATNISKLTAKRKVLVLDFSGPDKLWLPFSAWLADQFSAGLVRAGEPLEIIPRSQLADAAAERHRDAKAMFEDKVAERLAESLGAHAIVKGSFVAFGDGLIVAITYLTTSGSSWASAPPTQNVHAKIHLTPEIAVQLGVPLDSLRPKDGAYRAGEAGFGSPRCVRCPRANYADAAAKRKVQGTVVLEAIIDTDGSVRRVKVTRSLEISLDEEARRAVRGWKFKPATDPDGNPVPVLQTIEVTFHLF